MGLAVTETAQLIKDSKFDPEFLEATAKALWEAEPHRLLESSGYPVDWDSQPRIIKKGMIRKANIVANGLMHYLDAVVMGKPVPFKLPLLPQDTEQAIYAKEDMAYNISEELLVAMEDQGIDESDLAKRISRSKRYVQRAIRFPGDLKVSKLFDICLALNMEMKVIVSPGNKLSTQKIKQI